LLALAAACDLDPKSVGDEGSGSESDSTSVDGHDGSESLGADSVTTGDDSATGVDPSDDGAGEVVEELEGYAFRRLLLSNDVVHVLGVDDSADLNSTVHYFELPGAFTGSNTWYSRYFEAFAVGLDGHLAYGGWRPPKDDPGGSDPYLRDAYLALLGDDAEIPVHDVMLAGDHALVTEVASGGGTLWTLTWEGYTPGNNHPTGVLRRHGPEGAVELTHSLVDPSYGLAVDMDGFAYAITWGFDKVLHRVAPDGEVAWSLPMEFELAVIHGGAHTLRARPDEPGVVMVSAVANARDVRVFDGDGAVLHEFPVLAEPSDAGPAADVGNAIVLTYELQPETYVVDARSLDGTPLWSATRSVAGASKVTVVDVLEIPGGAVVIGKATRDGAELGFIRFIEAS
jgi:hypothetical protein